MINVTYPAIEAVPKSIKLAVETVKATQKCNMETYPLAINAILTSRSDPELR